jgi:hypothetical protein
MLRTLIPHSPRRYRIVTRLGFESCHFLYFIYELGELLPSLSITIIRRFTGLMKMYFTSTCISLN